GRLRLGHVRGTADQRATGRGGGQFREGTANRHVSSLSNWGGRMDAGAGALDLLSLAEAQATGPATIALTTIRRRKRPFLQMRSRRNRGLSRTGTEPRRFPNAALTVRLLSGVEQPSLRPPGRSQPEVLPARFVEAAPARRAGDEAELDEVRLDHVLDRRARLGEPRGERC